MRTALILLAITLSHCIDGAIALNPTAACRIPGIDDEVRCGTIDVPERPGATKTIAVSFAVVRAGVRRPEPDPVFILAGGPGQSAIDIAGPMSGVLAGINRRRDLVFVDQRGTGRSTPINCRPPHDQAFALGLDPDRFAQHIRRCMNAQSVDLGAFTTEIAVGDFERVRALLGYQQINLWGGSYGTRAALEYLRQFPERVRSMVLDGVAPADMALPVSMAVDADRAFDGWIERCTADPICGPRYGRALSEIDQLLRQPPRTIRLADPTTGQSATVTLDRDTLLSLIRAPLYVPALSAALPALWARTAAGDPEPLLALGEVLSGALEEGLSIGLHLAVACAEDLPRVDAAGLEETARTRFGRSVYDYYQKLCSGWPGGRASDAFYAPERADVPALLLSGGLDPVTPPRHAAQIALRLPRSRHLIAPNLGHLVTPHGCAARLVEQFIKEGSALGLDPSCLEKMPAPPFFVPPAEWR